MSIKIKHSCSNLCKMVIFLFWYAQTVKPCVNRSHTSAIVIFISTEFIVGAQPQPTMVMIISDIQRVMTFWTKYTQFFDFIRINCQRTRLVRISQCSVKREVSQFPIIIDKFWCTDTRITVKSRTCDMSLKWKFGVS